MNVKSTFFNGYLESGYMKKRKEKETDEEKEYTLKNALYGLKHALQAWNTKTDTYFQKNGFVHSFEKESPWNHALYPNKNNSSDIPIVCLYVGEYDFTLNNCKPIELRCKLLINSLNILN